MLELVVKSSVLTCKLYRMLIILMQSLYFVQFMAILYTGLSPRPKWNVVARAPLCLYLYDCVVDQSCLVYHF